MEKVLRHCAKTAVTVLTVVFLLLVSSYSKAQIQEEVFYDGTSWTVPAGVFSVTVECWGAGGGGGRATSAGQTCGGGGGGAYSKLNTLSVTPGQVISYSIGAGGLGSSTGSGNPGGDTWFSSTSTVLAKGGGGVAQNSTAAGAGGASASGVGNVKFSGGNGGTGGGSGSCRSAGGGGGGAGSTGAGNNGGNGSTSGGFCVLGVSDVSGGAAKSQLGGAGGAGRGFDAAGGNGSTFGGGGGGAKSGSLSGTTRNGGNGAQGGIRLSYCIKQPTVDAGATVEKICKGESVVLSGSSSAATTPVRTSSITPSPAVTIPDNLTGVVIASFNIAPTCALASAITSVQLQINHSWNADLEVILFAPNGSGIYLLLDHGGDGNNVNCTFQTGGAALPTGNSTITGARAPAQAFSNLTGYATGRWQMYLFDDASGDIGTFVSATLNFPAATCSAVSSNVWTPNTNLSSNTSLTPTANPSVTTNYTLTATSVAGCDATDVVEVNVLDPGAVRNAPTGPQCSGTTLNFTSTPVGGNGTYTYAWSATNPTTTGSSNTFSYAPVNTGAANITPTVTIDVTSNGKTCSQSFTPTIYPVPVLSTTLNNATYCNGDVVSAISLIGTPTGVTFDYTGGATIGLLNAIGATSIPSFTATNNGSAPVTRTITVTPKANGCIGADYTYDITVNPTNKVTTTLTNKEYCNGEVTSAINLNGTPSGVTFDISGGASIGLADATGLSAVPSFTAVNTGNSDVVVTITVTPQANGCNSIAETYTITVHPTPALSTVLTNATYCNNDVVSAISLNGTPTGVLFDYSGGATIGLANASGVTSIASFTATNTGNAAVTRTITVTPTANTCTGPDYTYDITVNPTNKVTTVLTNKEYCNGEVTSAINLNGTPSGVTFDISGGASIGLADATGLSDIPSFTAVNTGNSDVVVTITVTPQANGCSSLSETYSVTVHPTPAFTFTNTNVSCFGGNNGTITATVTVGVSPFDFSSDNGSSYTNNQTSPHSFSGLTAGVYPVVVRDNNGCISAAQNVTVSQPLAVLSVTASNGGAYSTNMIANLYSVPTGGTTPYTYNWSGPSNFAANPQHLIEDPTRSPTTVNMSGTYSIIVTDANGCTASATTVMSVYDGYVWNGSFSSDWNNPVNWTHSGFVNFPDNCTRNAIIPGGTVNNPNVNVAGLTIGKLTVVNGAIVNLANDLATCSDLVGSATALVSQINGPGRFIMQGTSPTVTQKISGKTKIETLQINNSGIGAEITGGSTQINTALELRAGNLKVATASNLVFLSTSTTHSAVLDNFSPGFTGTFNNGGGSSVLTAQRYYAATSANSYKQHYMSSPVNALPLNKFAVLASSGGFLVDPTCDETQLAPGSPQGNVLQYNEAFGSNCSLEGYEVLTTGSIATNGKGYSIRKNTAPGTISVTGEPNLNPAGYPQTGLTNSSWSNVLIPSNTTVTSGSWLIGNPFLAYLDLAQPGATTSNAPMNNEVHVWNTVNGNFDDYVIGTDPSIPIAPFQSFWRVNGVPGSTNGSTTVNGAARSRIATTPFYQLANDHDLVIHVNNSATGLNDRTIVSFNSTATAQFDGDRDAHKFTGAYDRHTLYTVAGNEMLSRNTLKSIDETSTVNMGFYPGVTGNYEMTFDGLNSFDPTSYIMLEDKQTNTWHNVRNGNYTFSSATGNNNDRFVLHFTPAATFHATASSCAGEGQINIEQAGSANWNYSVADNNSNTVATGTLNQNNPIQISVPAGVYTVTLIDNNNYTVVKQLPVTGVSPITANMIASEAYIEEGENVTFATSTANASTIEWNFGDGATQSQATQVTHTYAQPGTYTATLTVTNADGCTDTKTQSITVTAKVVSGVVNVAGLDKIKMWSNANRVFIDFSKQKNVEAEIEIYNIIGQQLVREKFGRSSVYSKEFQNMEAAYVVVRVNNRGEITTQKLFIANTK